MDENAEVEIVRTEGQVSMICVNNTIREEQTMRQSQISYQFEHADSILYEKAVLYAILKLTERGHDRPIVLHIIVLFPSSSSVSSCPRPAQVPAMMFPVMDR